MKNLFLLFALLPCLGLWGQHIYVRAYAGDKGGWIVTSEGKTLHELPGEWRVSGHDAAMAPVKEWPILLWKNGKYPAPNDYALLHLDGSIEELSQFTWAREMGSQLLFVIMDGERGVLWHKDGYVLGRELKMLSKFDERGLTVVGSGAYQGLMDTLGQFFVPPVYKAIVDLGKDCFFVKDTLEQSYLLHLKSRRGKELSWDTLANPTINHWQINSAWPFSEGGYLLVKGKENQLQVIDTTGRLLHPDLEITYRGANAFSEGRLIVGTAATDRKLGILNTDGQWVKAPQFDYLLDYEDGRALAHDTLTGHLGYLDRQGEWAIAARYCYANSFRYGLAIVGAPGDPKRCEGTMRQRGPVMHRPGSLARYRNVRNYQLLDTSGQVVWQDSCREVWLPIPGVVGCNYNEGTYVPAYRLEWLATGKYWLSPDFVFTRWEQIAEVAKEEVIRINLGARRRMIFRQQVFPLPEGFTQILPTLTALENLNLNYHEVAAAWTPILNLENLRKLSVHDCKLTELPADLKILEQLEELDISGNELTELPRSIFRMRHLRVLNIADNPLPPAIIPRLRKALPDTEIVYK
ncbi:WG repeat-containing protein [Lewinella cohaerens]|uniref:WG repeat-containing protein n=1 Tax=Lewinella cohaerens TaxID=70995 RepID=UPI0003703B57|nr:WG repeat-containing protein [Lewinella cohaerens]